MSLLDVILKQMVLLPMRQHPKMALERLKDLYAPFKMIVGHGLDPGQLWNHRNESCASPLLFLGMLPFFAPPQFLPIFLDIIRTIIEHSVQYPFSTADFTVMLRFLQKASANKQYPTSSLILHQEYWPAELEIKETLRPFQRNQKPEKVGPRDGQCFRTCLEHGVDHREAIVALRETATLIDAMVRFAGLPEDIVDQLSYRHVVICLEFGIDLQDDRAGASLLTTCREGRRSHATRTALRYMEWKEEDIDDVFEADLVASLVFQLAHLGRGNVRGTVLPITLGFEPIAKQEWDEYLESLASIQFSRCPVDSRLKPSLGPMGNASFDHYQTPKAV